MERNLSFCFRYDENRPTPHEDDCPTEVRVAPNPHTISDVELVLAASTCIQALSAKHGLEQALSMFNDAFYGKLQDGTRFDTYWTNSLEDDPEPE